MYDKCQKAAPRINQTGKEFGAYLQSMRSNLLDLSAAGASNATQLIHCIQRELRSEICTTVYQNPIVPKD